METNTETFAITCTKIRKGRTERETLAAALKSIDESGSLYDFKRGLDA